MLATQTLPLRPFKTMAVNVDGQLPAGVSAKDIILAVIAKIGTGGGQGYVIEYRGSAIESLSMEGRMTICNMSIEAGRARGHGRARRDDLRIPARPSARADGCATGMRRSRRGSQLRTDDGAEFDTEVYIDATTLSPFVTWGTNPGQGVPLSASVPDPELMFDDGERQSAEKALAYMDLRPGTAMRDIAGRHRLRRLVHQRAHRGSARGRRRAARPQGRRRRADARRARLDARARAGRIGGPRRDLHRRRRGVATGRLLDVSRHEPRSARRRDSAARRRPTAISRAGRARAAARIWCRRPSPPPPPCAARCRRPPTSSR